MGILAVTKGKSTKLVENVRVEFFGLMGATLKVTGAVKLSYSYPAEVFDANGRLTSSTWGITEFTLREGRIEFDVLGQKVTFMCE